MKSKQYTDNAKKVDHQQMHSDSDAIGIVKSFDKKRFDETVDVVVRLGVDPRKADQMVRGTVSLPAGTGKDVRVAVFAQGEAASAASEAGAEHVGADDLAAQISEGMTDFDVAIATPDMMPTVGKLGRILGPRGLMPNPKTGTVTGDAAKAVRGGGVDHHEPRSSRRPGSDRRSGLSRAGPAAHFWDAAARFPPGPQPAGLSLPVACLVCRRHRLESPRWALQCAAAIEEFQLT